MSEQERRSRARRVTPDGIDERTLPHNLEAERSVLGAILLHNDAFIETTRHITSADFYRKAHRLIFEAMERLLETANGSIDLVTLKEDLGTRGVVEEVGGPAYISALVDGIPRSTNVGHYAGIVKEKSLLRGMIATANTLLTEAYAADEPAATILAQADQAIVTLSHGQTTGRMRSLASSSHELLDTLEYRVAHRGELTGVDTGFTGINDITSGWQAADVIVLAARPSIGKTAFTLNTAVAAAQTPRQDGSPRRVVIFSMEMRRRQLEDRILASLSGVPLTTIQNGWMTDLQWGPITEAIGLMHSLHIHIDDASGRSVRDIRAECRRLRTEGGLDLVIIDYIQLMPGTLERRGANRNEEVTDISRKLKILADEVSVPILVLSQLNRAAEGRSDPRPKLSDLRESGALEQDADIVAFLHRKHHRESGVTVFIVDKQRNGPGGTTNLTLDRDIQRFTDGGEEALPSPAEQQIEAHDAKVRAIKRAKRR